MKIEIRKPLCFTEIGRKDQQEDSLFPRLGCATTDNRYFLVCDGVGGSEHGEVASATVSQAIGEYLAQLSLPDGVLTEEIFASALDQAYNALDYAESQQAVSFKKMATTLTFLGIHRRGCLIAHIGDSRVYHVRPGVGILSRTNDHSLVNDLIKAGELTPEQAKTFKQKNIITRAMQPLMEVRDKAEITRVLQVEAGDYFFLCCDGVLEHLQDEDLVSILSKVSLSDEEKLAAIKAICDENNTRDNYTCYLVPIESVIPEPLFDAAAVEEEIEGEVEPEEPVVPTPAVTTNIPPRQPVVEHANPSSAGTLQGNLNFPNNQQKPNSNKFLWYIVGVLLVALIACLGFIMLGSEKDDVPETSAPVKEAPTNLAPPRGTRPAAQQQVQETVTEPASAEGKNKPRVTLPGAQSNKGKENSSGLTLNPGGGAAGELDEESSNSNQNMKRDGVPNANQNPPERKPLPSGGGNPSKNNPPSEPEEVVSSGTKI